MGKTEAEFAQQTLGHHRDEKFTVVVEAMYSLFL